MMDENKGLVWVIDDYKDIRDLLKLGLENIGWNVKTFQKYDGVIPKPEDDVLAYILDYNIKNGIDGGTWLRKNRIVRPEQRIMISESFKNTPGYHCPKPFRLSNIEHCLNSIKRYQTYYQTTK